MHNLEWWRRQGAHCKGIDALGVRQAFADLCEWLDDWTAFTPEHWEAFKSGAGER